MAGKKREAVREAVAQAGGIEAAVAPGRQGAGPVHRRAAPARDPAAARPAPDQRGAELREPADGAHRGDDGGRALGEPEHDVPAAAPARGTRADRRAVGAPGAALAPLLLAHRRRAAPSTRGWSRRCGPFLDSVKSSIDEIVRRSTGGEDGASARAALPLTPPEVLALWADVERWPSFVEGFARRLELTATGRSPGGRVVWESTPDGRGRVTETVTENDRRPLLDPGLRGSADRHPDAAGAPGERRLRGRAEPRLRAGPVRPAPRDRRRALHPPRAPRRAPPHAVPPRRRGRGGGPTHLGAPSASGFSRFAGRPPRRTVATPSASVLKTSSFQRRVTTVWVQMHAGR